MSNGFLKYFFLSCLGQFVLCIALWIATFMLHPWLDSLFETMIFFYWPTIVPVAAMMGPGKSAMIAAPVYGMLLGMVLYGVIFGLIASLISRKKDPVKRSRGATIRLVLELLVLFGLIVFIGLTVLYYGTGGH